MLSRRHGNFGMENASGTPANVDFISYRKITE